MDQSLPVSARTESEIENKKHYILSILHQDVVNIEQLKKVAITYHGFVNQELRQYIWPLLMNVVEKNNLPSLNSNSPKFQIKNKYQADWKYSNDINTQITFHTARLASQKFVGNYMKSTFALEFEDKWRMMIDIICQEDYELYQMLQEVHGNLNFTLSWLLTWFSHDIDNLEVVQRIFDVCLTHQHFEIYMAIVIIMSQKQKLVSENTHNDIVVTLYIVFQSLNSFYKELDFDYLILQASDMYQRHPFENYNLSINKTDQNTLDEISQSQIESQQSSKFVSPDYCEMQKIKKNRGGSLHRRTKTLVSGRINDNALTDDQLDLLQMDSYSLVLNTMKGSKSTQMNSISEEESENQQSLENKNQNGLVIEPNDEKRNLRHIAPELIQSVDVLNNGIQKHHRAPEKQNIMYNSVHIMNNIPIDIRPDINEQKKAQILLRRINTIENETQELKRQISIMSNSGHAIGGQASSSMIRRSSVNLEQEKQKLIGEIQSGKQISMFWAIILLVHILLLLIGLQFYKTSYSQAEGNYNNNVLENINRDF
ncbi:tbc1 domain family member 20 [Stylonychia lemnae]|uniref:Tbc1 domain family member 20 n=1 Tax=Stylonychia lemnae TaxID=5949 RepID=A0A078AQX2_STYLE|nr:tbc1 domain family member 20 [Stylonychia lemnae]|eukprot:CDW84820.1 tbc1 domain family member 20 [Stylonychia lemnae]